MLLGLMHYVQVVVWHSLLKARNTLVGHELIALLGVGMQYWHCGSPRGASAVGG